MRAFAREDASRGKRVQRGYALVRSKGETVRWKRLFQTANALSGVGERSAVLWCSETTAPGHSGLFMPGSGQSRPPK